MKDQKRDAIIFFLISGLFICVLYFFYHPKPSNQKLKGNFEVPAQWLDSMLQTMSVEEKMAQLYLWEVDSVKSVQEADSILLIVKNIKPAGLIVSNGFFLNKSFADTSLVPLIWGFKNKNGFEYQNIIPHFPSLQNIERITNKQVLKQFYSYCALEAVSAGYHYYFQPLKFSDKAFMPDSLLYKQNMLTASALLQSYFDTLNVQNSVNSVAISSFLDSNFVKINGLALRELMNENIPSLFVDSRFFSTDSLQTLVVKQITENGYTGQILCNVGYQKNEALAQAIFQKWKAGTEIFYGKAQVEDFVDAIRQLLKENKLTINDINEKTAKMLAKKYRLGLFFSPTLSLRLQQHDSIYKVLISRRLHEKSICLYRNNSKQIPLKMLEKQKYTIYFVGEQIASFTDRFRSYADAEVKGQSNDALKIANMVAEDRSNFKIVCLNASTQVCERFISAIKNRKVSNFVIVNFGKKITIIPHTTLSLIDNSNIEADYAAQALWGGIAVEGYDLNVPVKEYITAQTRVKYSIPEDAGLSSVKLKRIDSLANVAIRNWATPGCQVFAIKNGQVVFSKAYGKFTYDGDNEVDIRSLYDIASVTKIAGATLAAMKMYDQGKIRINTPLAECFQNTFIEYTRIKPDTLIEEDTLNINHFKSKAELKRIIAVADTTHINDTLFVAKWTRIYKLTPSKNIFKVTFEELLIHESGVLPSLPMQNLYQFRRSAFNRYFSHRYSDSSFVKVADSMYLRKAYFDTLWINIKQLPVSHTKIYQYSDVNMILLQQAIDSMNRVSIDTFLRDEFFKPLGLRNIDYLPLRNFKREQIVPTVLDKSWRHQLLQGYVHDPSAAILGGISGNAGMFSSAENLGIVFQMILNGGYYGGRQYLSTETVNLFATKHSGSKRALGFDTPSATDIIAQSASNRSYGHTGFTGCCVWVDPDAQLVYVFLSNRVHPNSKNWKLNGLQTRQKIHQVFYDAMQP